MVNLNIFFLAIPIVLLLFLLLVIDEILFFCTITRGKKGGKCLPMPCGIDVANINRPALAT